MQQMKFVIVGHVDHGKSTLIGRLFFDTGSLSSDKIAELKSSSKEAEKETEFSFLMDHFKEEREQRITIDTAQIFFKTKKREYVIIDAPGHVEFIKNMITGASQADAGVVIIDASEGVKEETKRHSYILSMLGLDQVIVLINKMDLTGYKEQAFNTVKKKMSDFLDSINIKPQYYIPVSATKGDNAAKRSDNMNWYKGPTVLDALDSFKNKISLEKKAFIFPVQDVYKMNEKRIIVGRVEAGRINIGDKIKILPSGQITSVRSIEKYLEKNIINTSAGESIGITFTDTVSIDRGYIICRPGDEPVLTDRFLANIFWLSKNDLDLNETFSIRCATREVKCKVLKILKRIDSSNLNLIEEDAGKIKNLETGEIIIKTEKPVNIKLFNDIPQVGRFVLIRGEETCAGGIIIKISGFRRYLP